MPNKNPIRLKGHKAINHLHFLPDGDLVSSSHEWNEEEGDVAGVVMLWNLATRRKRKKLRDFDSRGDTAVSPDGRWLAWGGFENLIQLYELPACKLRATLTGPTQGPVDALGFAADSNTLVSSSYSDVTVWDVGNRKAVATLRFESSRVVALSFAPGGQVLATGGTDGFVELWDFSRRRGRIPLEGHEARVTAITFASGGRMFASVSEDGTLKVWDVATRAVKTEIRCPSRYFNAAQFVPGSTSLLTGDHVGNIVLWDAVTGKALRDFTRKYAGEIVALAVARNALSIAAGELDGDILLWPL